MFNSNTEHQEEQVLEEKQTDLHDLIVFNDDFNTFDHVIQTLIKVCGHEPIQAEQCTHIIHYSGKCSVKRGSLEELDPMCKSLLDAELTAEVQ